MSELLTDEEAEKVKEGWVTQHPLTLKPVEVVNAAYVRELEAELYCVKIALGKAAREIHCAGPVDHRIRILRAEHADRVGRMEDVIDAARKFRTAETSWLEHIGNCAQCYGLKRCAVGGQLEHQAVESKWLLVGAIPQYDKAREASKVADYRQAAEQIREHGDRMEAELRIVWRWMLGVWNSQEGHTVPMPEENRLLLIRDIHRVAGLIEEDIPAYIPAQDEGVQT